MLLACCLLGPLYVLALLPLLWKQIKLTLFFALCELTGGATLQILKHLISMPRPASAFEDHPCLMFFFGKEKILRLKPDAPEKQ